MKSKSVLIALLALCRVASLPAAEKIVAGPTGGRLLEVAPHPAEFIVNAERKVEITFLDAALKPVAPSTQVVAVTAEPAGGKTALELERTPRGFVSKTALPAGEPYRVVVQVWEKPQAKPKNFRIDLDLAVCGECQHAEYACICAGH